ncbi:EF-P lysine aminoacylase EpmA [Sandarakinorhabdus rubra]|uniref:EF-P lysine aminoacylase EpmA n=1 Tax=Sandarakinorhabdus rubra TaxID=2672568 RepID=UPI0013D8E9DC|nr:EF-P lysine aminoacylase EpmA [Sandarakinorhabdus rubra]
MTRSDSGRPFWHADIHADRRPFLLGRTRIKAALRQWFASAGFIEVECGAVQVSPGNETHLHGFPVLWQPEGGPAETRYLHTSPEFAAKKLLAAGETRIVDFARVWRNGELGPLHSPEFTMVEWYRAATAESGADWTEVIADTLALVRTAQHMGDGPLRWRGRSCDAMAEPEMLSVAEAFARHAGIDLAACLDSRDALAAEVARVGLDVRADDTWSDLFSRVIVAIEPQLGHGRITFLTHYPVAEAALARPWPADPRWAERFEAYACGVELANGFGELTDAAEQRRRFEADMDEKQRLYGRRYPIDEDFIEALSHMPPASGVALGFERLALLALGGTDIRQVIWTPFPG